MENDKHRSHLRPNASQDQSCPVHIFVTFFFFLATTHVCFFFILFVVLFGILNAFQIINSIKNTVADFFQKNFMIQGTIA